MIKYLKQIAAFFREKNINYFGINRLIQHVEQIKCMTAYMAWQEILKNDKYNDCRRLARYGFKVYSQADEDGIIQEIFHRIGTESRSFIEIGVGDGQDISNTLFLLQQGWHGVWIEPDPKFSKKIIATFRKELASGQLVFENKFVDKENIDRLLAILVPRGEADFLSLDVDGNDYHLIEAIHSISPRVIMLEYNAKFAPPLEWVMKYNATHVWDGTDYFGASLKSFELLLAKKEYLLVGCNIIGANAFFVREDLIGNHFCADYSAENHYEPARYWLACGFMSGHQTNLAPRAE